MCLAVRFFFFFFFLALLSILFLPFLMLFILFPFLTHIPFLLCRFFTHHYYSRGMMTE